MTKQRIQLLDNVFLTYVPADKFKTDFLSAQFITPLRAGTAGHDRSGDADDVSCADRRGQSGAQRLKAGYFFFRFLFAEDERKSELQPGQLQQLQPPGKVDAGAQQQDDERRAPDEIIDRCQQFVYLFQEKNLHSSTEAQKNGYHRRILCPFA